MEYILLVLLIAKFILIIMIGKECQNIKNDSRDMVRRLDEMTKRMEKRIKSENPSWPSVNTGDGVITSRRGYKY